MDDNARMKTFIAVTEQYLTRPTEEPMEPESEPPSVDHTLLRECHDLIFKLRSFTDDGSGDYALGVEAGLLKASDMLENLLSQDRRPLTESATPVSSIDERLNTLTESVSRLQQVVGRLAERIEVLLGQTA